MHANRSGGDTDRQVQRLLRVWQHTGDLAALWPDVSYETRRRAAGRIRALAEGMLRGDPAPLPMPDDNHPRALGIAAFTGGMGALVGWWIEHGQVTTSPAAVELFARHLAQGRRRIGLLRSQTCRVVSVLEESGVSPVLLKGMHSGSEFFPDPVTRPATDIDLLVAPADESRTASALRSIGFVESRRTVYGARSEWTLQGSGATVRSVEMDHSDNPWGLDIVPRLERWHFRGLRVRLGDGALETERSVDMDGQAIRVLDQPHLTAFLALHASHDLARMQLVRLVELVLVTRADAVSGRLNWDDLVSLLQRSGAWRFVYPAVELANRLAPGTLHPDLLLRARRATSARLRRVVSEIDAAEMGPLPRRSLRMKMAWAVGPLENVSNMVELMFPSDDGMGGLRRVYAKRARALRHLLARSTSGTSDSAALRMRDQQQKEPAD